MQHQGVYLMQVAGIFMTKFIKLLHGCAKKCFQTFAVHVEMYADLLLYYSDVDEYEYHLKFTALDLQCILAF